MRNKGASHAVEGNDPILALSTLVGILGILKGSRHVTRGGGSRGSSARESRDHVARPQWAGTGDHGEIGPFKYFGSNLQLFPDIKSPKSNFKMVFGHPKLLNQKLLGVFGS